MTDVTQILAEIEQGDPSAADQLLPLVYDELRMLAAAKLQQEKPGQTLQATALVHEVYVRLLGKNTDQHWDSRGHFFAAAAESMRRILVDQARRKRRPKHGGDHRRVELAGANLAEIPASLDTIAIHEALERFEKIEPEKAKLVKLRYFAGFTIDEAADLLGVSRATAKRHWAYARAWLYAEIEGDDDR